MLSLAARVVKGRGRRAMTVVEYIVAVAISSLLVLVLVPLSIYTATSLAGLANYADLNTASLVALDRLTRDVRRADGISDFNTNKLVLTYGTNQPDVRYTYHRGAGTLLRQERNQEQVLLTGCKKFTFSIYQRTPISGTYDQYPAATNTETKVIAVDWVTSRKLLGDWSTDDEVQSAKIVIRRR